MEQIIVKFAKDNKIGKAKAESFAQAIIAQYRAENPAKSSAGRPVSDQTIKLRANVVQAVKTLQERGDKATTETVAGVIGGEVNKVYLCNALIWAEAHGKLVRVGKDETKQGKGKKPVLWGIK